MNIIIPIGGVGKRFQDDGYSLPKPLIKALGKPVLFWNIENLNISENDSVFIIYKDELKSYNFEDILKNKFKKINFKFIPINTDTRGASETVLHALQRMSEVEIKTLTIVIDSDNFYEEDILQISKEKNTNLIFYKKDYEKKPIYSYITFDENSKLLEIKEKEKISDNACVGAYCFESAKLLYDNIKSAIIDEEKTKDEYYISGLYKILLKNKQSVSVEEIEGFNCLGTPNQLKDFSSNFSNKKEIYRFCFDLDNTLVSYPKIPGDYTSVEPILRNINFLNFLYTQGHTIIIYTARRMRTHNGNVGAVQADIAKITFETLDKFNIKYHEIYFGKPYANFYIDDLCVDPSQNLEKQTGFYNIHAETRDHNRIEVHENFIIKYSDYIDGEKYFYQNIPSKVSNYFPKLLDFGNNSIKIERIKGIPLSFLNVNNSISEKVLEKVLSSISTIHEISTDSTINIYANYFEKISKRINSYDFSNFADFETTKNKIISFMKEYESQNRGQIGLIHGDPVFTNILIDHNDNIKMLDMRGKVGDTYTIYGDIFYDYAKIYQSLLGYDSILMDKEIDISDREKKIKFFEDYVISKFGFEKMNDIKELTKGLLLSLIPIHNNEKCEKYYNLINNI